MQHTHTTTPSAQAAPLYASDAAIQLADTDYALGCECADPRLTIEMWNGEPASSGSAVSDPHH